MADKKYDSWSIQKIKQEIIKVRFIDLLKEKELCFTLTEKAKILNDCYALAFSYTYLSDYYLALRENEQCFFFLNRAKSLSETMGYEDLLIRIYNFLGMFYNSICDEMTALDYYLKSLKLCEKNQEYMSMATAYNNIATCFDLKHNYKEAITYYEKSFNVLEKLDMEDSEYSKAVSLTNLCNCSFHLQQADQLHAYLEKFDAVNQTGFVEGMMLLHVYCHFLEAYMNKRPALYNIVKDVFITQEKVENKLLVYQVLTNICDIFLDLQDQENANRCLNILKEINKDGSVKSQKELQTLMVRYHELFSDHEQQLAAYKEYYRINVLIEEMEYENYSSGLSVKIELQEAQKKQMDLEKEKVQLEKMMNLDDLTSIRNRRCFNQALCEEPRQARQIALAMLDIDSFKQYNDIYGHLTGDLALVEVGRTLKNYSSYDVLPYRYGGDEFVILFKNKQEAEVQRILKEIRDDILQKHIQHQGSKTGKYLSISYGYAYAEHQPMNMDKLLKQADENLYKFKKQCSNRCSD